MKYEHHKTAIQNITAKLSQDPEILAILITGSIAHGFQKSNSDVDIILIVSNEDYQRRLELNQIHYYESEACAYDGGYIDGKYTSLEFLEKVAKMGSEPARFAFEGAIISFSRIDRLQELINEIVLYPMDNKEYNITHFYAQFEAWNWYCHEAIKHDNLYLLNHSISNLILFGGRLILAFNEVLYPYHKWFLKVLEKVEHKPAGLIVRMDTLLKDSSASNITSFFEAVKEFSNWNKDNISWPNIFMVDSELNWLEGKPPIGDV